MLDELFLPEPVPREVRYTVISVDDHVVEPAHTFEGRLPTTVADRAPRIVETPEGYQVWEFEGARYTQVGMNAVAGRRPETVKLEPFRFEQMRPGCYDVDARIADMDVNGVWASVNFPSQITGFCGRVVFNADDRELGLACVRAWNDCCSREWYEPHPDRIVPLGITYLADPALAVAEIERNAARGFTSVTFRSGPTTSACRRCGTAATGTRSSRSCAATGTVISLHVGSSGLPPYPPGAPSLQLGATLFGQQSLGACAEWLWSGYAVKHPDLKIAMSEGGIGWVAMLLDRLDNIIDRSRYGLGWDDRPADVLRRTFWFCTIDDPSTIETRHRIGVDHVMVEVDYPHGDSNLARHPARHREGVGPHPARRAARHVLRERRRTVPPPAARHRRSGRRLRCSSRHRRS